MSWPAVIFWINLIWAIVIIFALAVFNSIHNKNSEDNNE